MAIYKFISHSGTGKSLNIYGTGQASDHRNVCLWTDSGSKEQQWSVDTLNGQTKVRSVLNTAYGLNIWRGTTNYNNCDIFTIAGNDKDSQIQIAVGANNVCTIKMVNYNLYLTATGTGDGANVNWQAWNGKTTQTWKAVSVGGSQPTTSYTYPTTSRRVSGGYAANHKALDITDASGVPIYAFTDGVVGYTQNQPVNWAPGSANPPYGDNSIQTFGHMIAVNHYNPDVSKTSGSYARTIYAHMKSAPTLKVGSAIKKGDIVGYMGTTGRSSGIHLHFALFVGNDASLKPGNTTWTAPSTLPAMDPKVYLPLYN